MAGPLPACCRFPLLIVLLLFLLLTGEGLSQPAASAGDRDTLLAVKKEWGSPPQLNSWDPAPDHCSWAGVTCAAGSGGPVTRLDLPGQNLIGSVPVSVCALRSLTRLDLSNNSLTGAFPSAALYACAELRFLDLSINQLFGLLPRDIDRLSPETMEHLNLSANGFSGEVPVAVARLPALNSLLLDSNLFTGAYPATEISNLAGLKVLTLGYNTFAPTPIPIEFAKLTNLTYLLMYEMSLTWEIPEDLASLTELTLLSLGSNNLTGSILVWVWHCQKLKYLDLYDNGLSGGLTRNVTAVNLIELDVSSNQLTGEIPEELAKPHGAHCHQNLQYLDPYNNGLSGELTRNVTALNLIYLDVAANQLSGDFPAKIWSSFPKLTWVIIQNNSFTGTLPAQIPPNIKVIYMGDNKFSGAFPTSAPALEQFYAENNRLGGELPSDMSKLSNLTVLSVPGNRITGSIPASIELVQKLQTLNLRGNQISGVIL
nr:unnamed protein product [Digitaria exilis]